MAIDDETLARVREALEGSERVEADRIQVDRGNGGVVLRGAVANAEQASAAALLAEREAPAVCNELRVDPNLRENPAEADLAGDPGDRLAPSATSADASAADHRSTRTDTAATTDPGDDLATDEEAALGENLAWDPPDDPVLAPTPTEQRGSTERDVAEVPPEEAGPVEEVGGEADDEGVSAADLSAAELAKSARKRDRGEA